MPWEDIGNSEVLAAHAALIAPSAAHPKGAILYWAGYGSSFETSEGVVKLFDLESGAVQPVSGSPDVNIFCAGHSLLADGRLAVGGGWKAASQIVEHPPEDQPEGCPGPSEHAVAHAGVIGVRDCWLYQPKDADWTQGPDMRYQPGHEDDQEGGGRWYPTLITLAGGDVLAVAGHPDESDHRRDPSTNCLIHNNNTPERLSATLDAWTILTKEPANSDYYPRLHQLRDGRVFFSSSVSADSIDPGTWNHLIYDPYPGTFDPSRSVPREAGMDESYRTSTLTSSVLLPLLPEDGYKPRVFVCGHVQPWKVNLDPGIAQPLWEACQNRAMTEVRNHVNATLLPTGDVLITGGKTTGSDDATAVKKEELYSPGIDWNTGLYTEPESWPADNEPGAAAPRGYHSVALLLPDGSVWSSGSQGPEASGELQLSIERYKPAYYDNSSRPETGAGTPVSVGYNQRFFVPTDQAGSIRRVALTRAGSVTHSFDADQRYVGLSFEQSEGGLAVTSPPDPGVAPPGYYLLWIVDEDNLPSTEGVFVRVCDQKLSPVLNHSTFSWLEVEALFEQSDPAVFHQAFTIVAENFLPSETAAIGGHPEITLRFDSVNGPTVPAGQMKAVYVTSWWEYPPPAPDVAQRKTFVYNVVFDDKDAAEDLYSFPGADRMVKVIADFGHFSCVGDLELNREPNPYINDVQTGYPEWLSVDLRTFKVHPDEEMEGTDVVHGAGAAAPVDFIRGVLERFNEIELASPNDPSHPFLHVSETDMAERPLELAVEDDGGPVFNYAVAKVRYRALTQTAERVRVFFRLFTTAGTAMEFTTNPENGSYPAHVDGDRVVPLLGRQGTNLVSIPCFATARVTPGQSMESQEDDPPNVLDLPPHPDGSESVQYFGAWLDFNQTAPHIPRSPSDNGPFGGDALSIQELVRNHHLCLIAEVYFDGDPTPALATPASSDNLSQRNLVVVETPNPDGAQTVAHTFEVKPSAGPKRILDLKEILGSSTSAAAARRAPDELVLIRNNLPVGTEVSLYFPQVEAEEILTLAELRHAPPVLTGVDEHTVRLRLGDVGYVPLPGGRTKNIPGLLSLEAPPGATAGKVYRLTVQQFSGMTRRVTGSFELQISVKPKEEILPAEIRRLSVLRHIAKAIPPPDRWYPIFSRYLDVIASRVRELGGDPDAVPPSPRGRPEGEEPVPGRPGRKVTGKVSRILYDCFGDYEGFVLVACERERTFSGRCPGLEEVVLRACRERMTVTVRVGEDESSPLAIELHCC